MYKLLPGLIGVIAPWVGHGSCLDKLHHQHHIAARCRHEKGPPKKKKRQENEAIYKMEGFFFFPLQDESLLSASSAAGVEIHGKCFFVSVGWCVLEINVL